MSSLQELYNNLKEYNNFEIEANSEKFLDTVDKIIKHQNPSSIGVLLGYFDDDTEYSWVLQSISSAMEHFPVPSYVDQLLINLPTLLQKGSVWADNFFNRIFNHPTYLDYFKRNIHKIPKEYLLKLFDIMEQESPHHKILIAELRKELMSS